MMIYRNSKVIRGNNIIWHYLSWDKFLDLLLTNELWFSSVSSMTDKTEGQISDRNANRIRDFILKTYSYKISLQLDDTFANRTFISCWSMSREESYALWKIYLSNSKSGVAIRTTISKLEAAMKKGNSIDDIFVRKILYGDIDVQKHLDASQTPQRQVDLLRVSMKKAAYEYEKEVRFICFPNVNPQTEGIRIKLDSLDFIDGLYFSPLKNSFNETYKTLLKKLKFDIEKVYYESEIKDQ